MPLSLGSILRVLTFGLLTLHAFLMYSTARGVAETVGFHLGTSLMAVGFSMILMIPFVWAFGLADLPQILERHVRPLRRWKRGLCPGCGYRLQGLVSGACPECGRLATAPPPYRYSLQTVKRFLLLVGLALALGCASAEATMLYDEHQFRSELRAWRASGADPEEYARERLWPNTGVGLVYVNGAGVRQR